MSAITVDTATAGAKLRSLREAHGWSRPQLADRTGISEATIKIIEQGFRPDGVASHPYPKTVTALAKAFGRQDGITVLEVFGYQNLADDVFPEDDRMLNPELGLSTDQEAIIERIVEALVGGLVELAHSESKKSTNLVDLSKIRAIPRYVKTPGLAHAA